MMEHPSFKSDIFYSVQNEDYRTELAVLERIYDGTPLRVLMVASSGENALSLLTSDRVGEVHAVDINPAQLQLCELRMTAPEHLARPEQLRLLGAEPVPSSEASAAASAEERGTLLDRVLPHLSDAAAAFWDNRRHQEVAFGIQRAGRNETAMRDLQARLAVAGLEPLKRPLLEEQLRQWQKTYVDLLTPAYIQDLFGLPSLELAERISSIAGYLGECHFRALRQPSPERNYFLTTVFANAYAVAAGEDGLPLYLQTGGQTALRELGTRERFFLYPGSIFEQMSGIADQRGLFDLVSISNIADWLSAEQFGATVAQARACLKPGGALLSRTGTPSDMGRQVMARELRWEESFNDQLARVERGPWFRNLAVGFRAQGWLTASGQTRRPSVEA